MAIDKSKYAKGLDYVETQKKAQEAKEKAQQAGKPASAQSVPFSVGVTRAQIEGIESESAPVPSDAVTQPKAGRIGGRLEDAMKSTFDSLRSKVAAPTAEPTAASVPQVRPVGVQPAGMLYGDGGKSPLSSAQKMRGAVVDKLNNLTSQDMLRVAQKEYDDYLQSDEYKQKKQAQQAAKGAALVQGSGVSTGAFSTPQKAQEDVKEKELRAKRDYYHQQFNQEETQRIMEADLAEFEKWPEEDKQKLRLHIGAGMGSVSQIFGANPEALARAAVAQKELEEKYGKDTVDRLMRSVSRSKNAQMMQEAATEGQQAGEDYAVLGSAATVPMNLIGSISAPIGYLSEAVRGGKGQYPTLDPNNIGNLPNVYSGAVRGQVAQDIAGDQYDENGNLIKEGGALRQGLSYAYQGGMSALDSVARAVAGGGSTGALTLAAMGSFGQTMSEASKQGATPTQALILATGTAALEAATEKIPLERMLGAAKGGAKGARAIAKEALVQAGIEATTEEVSLLGSLIMEAGILRGKSSYNTMISEAIANGASYEDARAQADKAVMQEALQTLAVSGFAGFFSGAGSAMVGSLTGGNATNVDGGNITPNGGTEGAQPAPAPQVEAVEQTPVPQAQAPAAQPVAAQETVKTPEQVVLDAAAETGRQFAQPAAEPKSQLQQTIDNAAQKALAEQGIGEAAQQEQVQEAVQTEIPQERNTAGIKGTGAAEANFSGKAAYQDLLTDDNTQRDRADDVRPMEVPKVDANGNPVSETAANVYGSQYTPDDLASEMESRIAKGELGYIKISNDQAAEKARTTIENAGGWKEAYLQWHDQVRAGKTGAEMAARGAMLLNHAAEVYEQTKATGNAEATKTAKQEWLSILLDVREMGTNTAQGLQAMRLIRQLSPPDKLDFAVASVKRMVSNMKLSQPIEIDEKLLNEYRMAETDELRDEVMGRIQQNVAQQIPSTWLDKWTALRYTNMLGNLKTQGRNLGGNVGSMLAYRTKDQVAALAEDFIKLVNKDYQRTKSHTVSKAMLDAAKADFETIKAIVQGGGKYNERMSASDNFTQGILDERRIFKSNAKNETVRKVLDTVMAPVEAYRKGTNWMMNNKYFGDEAFGRVAYSRALAGYLKANGVRDGDFSKVDSALMDKARAYAIKQAQEATFKDNSALANIASKVKRSTGVVGEGIVPFTKTPANVLVRAEEFSPLGLLNTAVKTAQLAAGKGEVTGADVIDSLAKSITGTGLFALGALLYNVGWLSAGADDDEKQEAFDKMNGEQNYALQFVDDNEEMHSYTMDWLTPVAMPMFMGAEFWEMLQEADGERTFADYEQLFTAIGDPLIQMSMLQGLNDSLESIKYSDNNMGQFLINAAVSYLTQGLTNTLVGQIERSTEDERMTTYVDKDSQMPQWMQRELGKASQKIPGLDFQQTEYLNAWGETERNEGGLAYNLASPGYFKTADNSALTQELNRLRESTGMNVFPQTAEKSVTYTDKSGNRHQDYNMSAEEYQKLQQTQGQTAKRIVGNLVNSKAYQKLTDAQKAYAIQAAYEYAKEMGKREALPDYYSEAAAWISGTKETDTAAFIARGAYQQLDSVVSQTVENLGQGWAVSPTAKQDLESLWQSYKGVNKAVQNEIMGQAEGDAKLYLEARKGGVDASEWMQAMGKLEKVQPIKGAAGVKQWQNYSAIANAGLDNAATDAMMRAYMDDSTERKYNWARDKMGYSAKDYTSMYAIFSRESGEGKAERVRKQWIENYGLTEQDAKDLYKLLGGTWKPWEE
jgi:hypothetical protein